MICKLLHRIHFVSCLFLAICCLEACDADSEFIPKPADAEQSLIINLSTRGDRLTTRAGRPLHSSEAKQDVHHITIYVLNNQGIVLQKQIERQIWQQAWNYPQGRQLLASFKESENELLPIGEYTLYAVAFSQPSDYKFNPEPLKAVNAITTDGTFDSEKIIPFTNADFEKQFAGVLNEATADGEEVFAGKVEVEATKDKLICKSKNNALTLNRQVAGVMGYFTNIPVEVGGVFPTSLRLIASNKNNRVNFFQLLEGETSTEKITYVVNGSQQGNTAYTQVEYGSDQSLKGYVVYDIKLADFFPLLLKEEKTLKDLDFNKDGYVGVEDIKYWQSQNKDCALESVWVNPHNTEQYPQVLLPGTVYDARFVIPFRWKDEYPTFELQLIHRDKNGEETFLKTWNIRIDEKQFNEQKPMDNTSTGVVVPIEGDKSTVCFNVYRNHFYALGEKAVNTSDIDDKPVDLSQHVELLITIHKQWSGSENMGIN